MKSRVEGLTKDVKTAKLHPKPIDEQPLGMMVSGVSYSEKAEAGQAIINACTVSYTHLLSGNVREKLRIAKNSAELYPEDYKVNVEALQKVQPKDLTANEK